MRRVLGIVAVLACVALVPSGVWAQDIVSGQIAGVVRDASGAVLPGVTVEASSAALIERVRTTVTDGTGQYRIVGLRPGTYVLTTTLTGFNTFKRENIEISGSAVVTINVDLKVGSIEETVTVSGETPVVDLQSTTRERAMSADVIAALPTGRMYYTLGVLVPGVASTSRDVGGALGDTMGALSSHGSALGDQRITQNGLSVMTLQTPTGSVGGMVPNTSAAQEVAIDTSGASAERQTGGVSVNFIPRDGGNAVRGSMFATGAYEGQQASNFSQRLADQGLRFPNKYKMNWDFNPGVGGPILKDKLWYYYTYRNNGAQNYAAGMNYNQNEFLPNVWTYTPNQNRPALSLHGDWWDTQLRLTAQVNSKNKVAGTWDQQYKCQCPNTVSSTTSPEAATDFRFPTQRLLHFEWWSPLTSKILLEFVALHRTERWGNMDLKPTDQGGSLNVTAQQYALYPQLVGVTRNNGPIPFLSFHGSPGASPIGGPFNNNYVPNYTYRFATSYITGAHALKFGLQDTIGYVTSTNYTVTRDTQGRPVRYTFDNANPLGGVLANLALDPVIPTAPTQVTTFNTPYTYKSDQNHDFGLFAQDRWTMNRLTLNLGVRFDWYNSSVPAQDLAAGSILNSAGARRPAASYAAIDDTVNWKDVTPRFGAAYDLQGDGKTAIKVSLNKYVAGMALDGLPNAANPIRKLTNNATRSWIDNGAGGGVAGDLVVDCDLANPAPNGECGAGSNLLSTAIPGADATNDFTGITDFNVRRGWNKRSYNWEFSAGVQRELIPRVSVDVSYFRRWFGNFTGTDNLKLNPSDFRSFDIKAPADTRLPGGGGNTITGYVDYTSVASALASLPPFSNRVFFPDDEGLRQVDHWNGIDVTVNARLQNGLLLQGGTSTGRRYTNNCDVTAKYQEMLASPPAPPGGVSAGDRPQAFCETTDPFRTQVKGTAAYTLPRYMALPATLAMALENVQIAATFQSIPGDAKVMSYNMPNAEFQTSCNAGGADPSCSTLGGGGLNSFLPPPVASKTVALINGTGGGFASTSTGTVFDERQNQLDLRMGRILRFGRTRTTVNFDVFNVFNQDTVLGRNNALVKNAGNGVENQVSQADAKAHTVWTPTSVLQARFFKVSATFDF